MHSDNRYTKHSALNNFITYSHSGQAVAVTNLSVIAVTLMAGSPAGPENYVYVSSDDASNNLKPSVFDCSRLDVCQ